MARPGGLASLMRLQCGFNSHARNQKGNPMVTKFPIELTSGDQKQFELQWLCGGTPPNFADAVPYDFNGSTVLMTCIPPFEKECHEKPIIIQDATPDVTIYHCGQLWKTVAAPVITYKLEKNESGIKTWVQYSPVFQVGTITGEIVLTDPTSGIITITLPSALTLDLHGVFTYDLVVLNGLFRDTVMSGSLTIARRAT